MPRTSSMRWW